MIDPQQFWRAVRQPHFIRQFIKFCFVGGTSAAINFTFYFSLTSYAHVWYVYSAAIGFIVSAIFNFISNKFWTFRNRTVGRAIAHQATKFLIVMVSGLLISTGIIYIVTDFFFIDWRLSWVFANGTVIFWSFGLNRLWTFRT